MRTLLAARAAESGSWKERGAASAAEDLGRRTGTSTGEAKETLKTSENLASQPRLAEALREGRLSSRHANDISSTVAVNPDAEAELIETATRSDLKGLRDSCRRKRADADADQDATNRRIHANRSFNHGYDSEGAFTGSPPNSEPGSNRSSAGSATPPTAEPARKGAARPSKRSRPTPSWP
jgi:hypothetical protein